MLHPFHLIIPKSHTVSLRSSSFYKENRADSQSTKRETKATDYCQLIGNRVQLIKQPIMTESTINANGIEKIYYLKISYGPLSYTECKNLFSVVTCPRTFVSNMLDQEIKNCDNLLTSHKITMRQKWSEVDL